MELLNISHQWQINPRYAIGISREREWSKKSVQQGRSLFFARSVLVLREHGKMARTPLAAFFNIPSMESLIDIIANAGLKVEIEIKSAA